MTLKLGVNIDHIATLRQARRATYPDPLLAAELCRCVGRRGAAAELAVRLERGRLSREELAELLEEARGLFAAALALRCGGRSGAQGGEIPSFLAKNLTKRQIMRTIELLQKYRGECVYNVGTGHVLGALAVELEGIL